MGLQMECHSIDMLLRYLSRMGAFLLSPSSSLPLPPLQVFMKLLVHAKTDRIIGMHMVGGDAGEIT